jgi:ankyrin
LCYRSDVKIAILLALAAGCSQQPETPPPVTLSPPGANSAPDFKEMSLAEHLMAAAQRQDVDLYKAAVIAAVHYFAGNGHVDDLVGILEHHPDLVDARPRGIAPPGSGDGYAPLHDAVLNGDPGAVEYLLERGADVNGDSGNGWTALHLAARSGRVEVCQLLLQRGANPNALTTAFPERPHFPANPGSASIGSAAKAYLLPAEPARTPLDVAREAQQPKIIDLLLERGKKKNDSGPTPGSSWSYYVERSSASSGGVDPYKKALITAMHHFLEHRQLEDVVGILERHPDLVDARLVVSGRRPKPDDGYTPIHRAARHGRREMVEYVLERKADINADAGNGWTPLRIAERHDQFGVAYLLREKGAKDSQPTGPQPEEK